MAGVKCRLFAFGEEGLQMAKNFEQLAKQAMSLPSESRAQLADLLVESLEGDDLGQIEQLWLAEAKRRRDEVRLGKVETVSGEEVRDYDSTIDTALPQKSY